MIKTLQQLKSLDRPIGEVDISDASEIIPAILEKIQEPSLNSVKEALVMVVDSCTEHETIINGISQLL